MAHFLFVIAANGFRDEEYFEPKEEVLAAGNKVSTASTAMHAVGSQGKETDVDILLKDASQNNYDAVVFVGGQGSYGYFEDQTALNLAKSFFEAGKITAAICAGPGILANAGLLNGKNFTCFSGEREHIESKGGIYNESLVVKDGLLITSQGAHTAREFGKALAKELK